MKPGRLSPTSSRCQVAAPVDSSVPFFSFSFPLLEYFKANPRHHVISPPCTSVCIKKFSVPPAIFRTRCYQEPLRQASFRGDLCGRSTPGLALQGFPPSSQSGTPDL